jgi:hypothetical protein
MARLLQLVYLARAMQAALEARWGKRFGLSLGQYEVEAI